MFNSIQATRTPVGKKTYPGFTIVELLVVIVVIAILAAVILVAYNGVSRRATESLLQADLRNAAGRLGVKKVENGDVYPTPTLPSDITASTGNAFQYTSDGVSYCLTATSSKSNVSAYHVSGVSSVMTGACSGHSSGGDAIADGAPIQTINTANCPTTRTRAVDARDNHTYWVQKLADGKCWMLTNLAYGGGGVNTYNDTKPLTDDTGNGAFDYATAKYYAVPSTTNYTTEPTAPSTATSGTGQYGYLYNWCGAMGGQATAACANATTPALDASISACPAGWRLPTGNGGEVSALNTAINSGATNTDAGWRTSWLSQLSGNVTSAFSAQGAQGYYWTSSMATAGNAYRLQLSSVVVQTVVSSAKYYGFAVRCIAS